ncbi:MAG: DUF1648 domain-containing protein [Dehalococcoidales bacterium]|nr:DUF1648 domain-containing protein [Dehalococcoidales bacterium]
MKNRIIHPLWVHVPSIGVFLYAVVLLVMGSPFPASVATHFNFQGVPDSHDSPWSFFGLFLGLSLLFIGLSVFLDELWARQEKSKTFNWLSLLDEIVVGALAGMTLAMLEYIDSGAELFPFPWIHMLMFAGITTVTAVLLEWLRPFRPTPLSPASGDPAVMESSLPQDWRGNKSGIYWESQNPLYITLLSICLPLVMIVSAAMAWFSQPWASLLLFMVGLVLVIPYSGMRTAVRREDVTVRFGLPGIRVLRIKTGDIAGLELKEFSPLRDFGGYGIRFNSRMHAYFMRGSRGVLISLNNGRKYLIGSDRPERLLAVLRVITGNQDRT